MARIFTGISSGIAIGLALFLGTAPAHASAPDSALASLSFAGDTSDIRAMSENELETARGGYRGLFFGLTGFGDITNLGGGLPAGVSIASQSPDLVSLNVGLASLPSTGGFIQFASIVGNNNIINNNLILNVYIIDGGVADTSGITNGSAFGF